MAKKPKSRKQLMEELANEQVAVNKDVIVNDRYKHTVIGSAGYNSVTDTLGIGKMDMMMGYYVTEDATETTKGTLPARVAALEDGSGTPDKYVINIGYTAPSVIADYSDGTQSSFNLPQPSDSEPLMDGTASAGSSDDFARAGHVHPTDTTRASASDLSELSLSTTQSLSSINSALSSKADLVNNIVPITQLPVFASPPVYGVATGLNTSTNPPTATGFNDLNGDPVTGTDGVFYFGTASNLTFLYNSSQGIFVAQGSGVQIGETSSTAYRGDRGKVAYDHSQITSGDPHGTIAQAQLKTVNGNDIRGTGNISIDKTSIGLGNVDNTSDTNKPVSTATLAALNGKENTIPAGTTAQYWRGDKSWQTLPVYTTLPNPFALTFTGGSTAVYDGSSAQSVAIPVLPTRAKAIHTGSVTLTSGTAVTISTTATVASTQTNARITADFTFSPDSATILLAGLLNTLNISVMCEFLINGSVVDTKYDTVQRTGTNQSRTFQTTQSVTAGQVVSIRFTPTFSAGSCTIPASVSANFITIL